MKKFSIFLCSMLVGFLLVPTISRGATFFFIADDGKVGIGTSSPTEMLEVVGNLKVSGEVIASNVGFVGALDDFDSYTLTNINGLSGGSGWAGDWIKSGGGTYDTVESPTFSFARAAHAVRTGGGTGNASRAISLGSHILYSVSVRQTSTTTASGLRVAAYTTSGETEYDVALDSGYIKLKSSEGDINIMSFEADKWYTVELEVDASSTINRARAKVEGGAFTEWTSWVDSWVGSETSNPVKVSYSVAGGDTYDAYVDSIQVVPVE